MRIAPLFLSLALIAIAAPVWAVPEGGADATQGEKLFSARCTICHSLDANKIGPALRGVYGRKAGIAEHYMYSPALKASGITWDEAKLDQWLTAPGSLVPGVKMTLKTSDPKDRADIIAYLKSLSVPEAGKK